MNEADSEIGRSLKSLRAGMYSTSVLLINVLNYEYNDWYHWHPE
jgi:hypothetical protein